MSIGQQLSPDAQYQLALKMPLDRLMAIIRGQPAQIDPATALAALKMHNQTKVAVQGQQAQQQLQKPDVANQEMQMASLPENSGVGRLPANNMNGIATAAQGGIVGYADGGEVQHFQVGGRPESTIGQWWRNLPVNKAGAYANSAEGQAAAQRMAALTTEREQTIILPYQAVTPEERKTRESRLADIENEMSVIRSGRSGASGFGPNYTPAPPQTDASQAYLEQLKQPIPDSVAAPAAPPAARNAAPAARNAAASASNVQMLPTGPMPREQGFMMGNEKQTPEGLAALLQGPVGSPAQAAAPNAAGMDSTNAGFAAMLENSQKATKPYTDAITNLLKQVTDTSEKDNGKKEERKGIFALKMAQALSQSGVNPQTAIGNAFGQMGDLAQQYAQTDDKNARDTIALRMSALGAQAQIAQGDTRNAATLHDSANKLAFDKAHLSATQAQHAAELAAKNRGLNLEEIRDAGTAAYRKDHNANIRRHNDQWAAIMGSRYANQGGVNALQQAKFETQANTAALTAFSRDPALKIQYMRQYPGESEAQLIARHAQTLLPSVMKKQQASSSVQLGKAGLPDDAEVD